ncbi:hypothetical protein [[Eubacterium] cellulosolvens]
MTDEERYTFSSLMTILIESEEKLSKLYEAMAQGADDPRLRSLVSDYNKNSLKRIEMMRRARVERVVEIALEPITSLKLADPIAEINAATENESLSKLDKAIALEKTVSELYAMASPKIMQTSADTGELLLALSRESSERINELEKHLKSG